MSIDATIGLFSDDDLVPQAGHPDRFGRRWRLVGAGLSDVWRYGDLLLPAASGRLLLRGPNGTGKTTALEALWPYLLDLNAQRLAAGKARPTSLSQLMREGAIGRRRYGYVWLTFAGPGSEGDWSFGVRLQFSEGASPPVRVVPFTVPGVPGTDVPLRAAGRAPLMAEEFTAAVEAAGGQVFADEEDYVEHLARRVWGTSAAELRLLATRLRELRNPSLLGEVSPRGAADALRASLPGVSDDVISATADALVESDATREAFRRDSDAASVLGEFADAWTGHVVDVSRAAVADARAAAETATRARGEVGKAGKALEAARKAAEEARIAHQRLQEELRDLEAEIKALERSDEYKAAGRLKDLQATADAQSAQARGSLTRLADAAAAARRRGAALRRAAADLAEDLAEQTAAAAAADPHASVEPLLTVADRPRAVETAGDTTADPGPALRVTADPAALEATAASWTALATTHRTQAADAKLALTDHQQVATADDAARRAREEATATGERADRERATADRAGQAARTAAATLVERLAGWATEHPDLTVPLAGTEDTDDPGDDGARSGWSVEDVTELAGAEPNQVLATADELHAATQRTAAAAAAAARRDADFEAARAEALRAEAGDQRMNAAELRAGKLLPLPRPEWAGPGDDTVAFAAALDWAVDFTDPTERALLEAALAASGALGAALTNRGAASSRWQVSPTGPDVDRSLADLVTVDADHPLAPTAAAVLARIALADTAAAAPETAALAVGRDGTFRAGVLHGRVPGALDRAALPPARHLGARQRLAAAVAEAERLEQEADRLEQDATELDAQVRALRKQARDVEQRAARFPERESLRGAEATRVAAEGTARSAAIAAEEADAAASRAAEEAQRAREDWVGRTRARGLPPDMEQLAVLRERGAETARALQAAAAPVAGKLRARLVALLRETAEDVSATAALPGLRATAQSAVDTAARTDQTLRTLREVSGPAAERAVRRYTEATQRESELRPQLGTADALERSTAGEEGVASERLAAAESRLEEVQPAAAAARTALRSLLGVPGVEDVVLGGAPLADDDGLLEQVDAALAGRSSAARKTLRERYDVARTRLAGLWTLDPGDDDRLDTFVLTHTDAVYTPPQAARHAHSLADRAEAALAAAEETALRDFVIGRLPSAIGVAWTRQRDWVDDVNRKMKTAAASSGVGVQVRVTLRDDLPAASRTVHELSCRVADADRTPEQKQQVGDALQALIAAADGETMTERLADAVDVRQWVDVAYYVTRPGAEPRRWGPKTGLSGGERRLIVLAPMLAAVAAAYDKFGEAGLRLAALDEVPAEVDERGREGLARFIAELDLDLVCTSYLWDGAPAAWDGIDAHDLEVAPDGLVVAFPMLVRGLLPLPGDPDAAPA
ncbi:SbcC/MukB-like Walker B domain-containing protein [Blastococcus mobilis]|uniref:Putative exonuclease SbcCD, C subunit n=1 Tax=Blastococcus mobilis TaxID=1938746 RepID=A0A238ZSD6_9ACTN|nr:SbcC/MukB-like Walker B domain-containing protein [Blastococcus mobilis]SNR86109.1 Putative exonuclease SbcCD, C subunit [Blastococcus mobilis]